MTATMSPLATLITEPGFSHFTHILIPPTPEALSFEDDSNKIMFNPESPPSTVVPEITTGSSAKGKGKETLEDIERRRIPSEEDLLLAAGVMLVSESGEAISFGDVVREREKVVVVFLRHMWCGLCQQYVEALDSATQAVGRLPNRSRSSTTSSSSDVSSSGTGAVSTELIATRPPLFIILISSGSPSLIPTYRQRISCPFPMFAISPRSRVLYNSLRMNRSLGGGSEESKGSYVKGGRLRNIVRSTISGLSMLNYPGDQKQLGGEFVFESKRGDDRISCSYASRMSTTRNHSEIRDLFAAAGLNIAVDEESIVYSS